MSWLELSIDTTGEAVDWVGTLLAEIQFEGEVRITPYAEAAEVQSTSEPHNWTFTFCFYLPNDATVTQVEEIERLLSPLHRTGLTTALRIAVVDDTPPATAAHPLIHRIGERFVVLAPDAPYRSQADDIILRLKPTLAFGSGLHPATAVALKLLERHVAPTMSTLDLGSGSGILSVAMAKLGAQVLALDNDSVAVESTQDAVDRNGVDRQVTVMAGSLGRGSDFGHWMNGKTSDNVPAIEAPASFDLIVANILARVHIALADDFRQALRRSDAQAGLLITSGFTTDSEEDVTASLTEVGFEAIDCERSSEWVALAHRLA